MQNEARKLNHQELVEEDKRMKLPPNHEAVQRRIQWEIAEEEAKKVSIWIALLCIEYCLCLVWNMSILIYK